MASVFNKCWRCQGVGTIPISDVQGGSNTCNVCGGSGKLEIGEIDIENLETAVADIAGKVDDVINKQADIKTKLDEIKTVVDAL